MRSAFRGPAHQLAVRMRINNCTHGHNYSYGPSNQPCTLHTPATARTPRVCTLVPFISSVGDAPFFLQNASHSSTTWASGKSKTMTLIRRSTQWRFYNNIVNKLHEPITFHGCHVVSVQATGPNQKFYFSSDNIQYCNHCKCC